MRVGNDSPSLATNARHLRASVHFKPNYGNIMSALFANARAWLAGIDPLLPAATLVLVVFAAIYAIRRWFPGVWALVEKSVPFVDSLDYRPVATVVWKAWQALPGALLGAVVSALSSGISVKSAVIGVLAGFAASLAHEVMAAYRGQVGARAKRPPSMPPLAGGAFALLLAICLGGCAWLNGTAWPVVKACAPSSANLLTQVEDILVDGRDVDQKLREAGSELGADGLAMIICAVEQFEGQASANTPELAAARARGRALLVRTGNAE